MRRTLTLHIGTPKSGTTHLQAILHAGRDLLRREGALYPGAGYLPRDGFNQQPAVYALAGATIGWLDEAARHNAAAHFERLCREVSAHPGHVLISAESLVFFDPAAAATLLERLGFDPTAVTVVITARDMGRLLPSIWQQNVKNGSTEALEPYLTSVATLRDRPQVPFWTAFGLPELVGRWSQVVGPDRVVLVTAPPRGADRQVLWTRFATAASVPAAPLYRPASTRPADDNMSLSPSQTELIRRMNVVMQSAGYTKDTQQRLRGRLLRIWMNASPAPGQQLLLPEHLQQDVERWAGEDIHLLRRSGVRVIGTLTDLAPAARPTAGRDGDGTVAPDPAGGFDPARDVLTLLEHWPASGSRATGSARWRALLRLAAGSLTPSAVRRSRRSESSLLERWRPGSRPDPQNRIDGPPIDLQPIDLQPIDLTGTERATTRPGE